MKYKLAEQALIKPLDEGAIALDLQTGDYYTLNEVAARMVFLLLDGNSEKAIIQSIVAEYDASPGDVARDLTQLLRDLVEKKLITNA